MPKCEVCQKEVLFLFVCSYCHGSFCSEHRLPENHQCPDLPKESLFWYQKRETAEKQASTYPPTLPSSKPQRNRKVRMTILTVSLATVLIIAFIFLSGIVEFNIGTPSTPSVKETTISRVITEGMISVFEDQGCTRSVQTIDWGKIESNRQYSRTVYVRNDNQEKLLDSGERDIVWQRENINPSSLYISIKINYGDTKIKPNEVRQATITLTVLGLLEDSDKLNSNAGISQFTFDLKLIGQDLNWVWGGFPTYSYISCYCNRDANNITVVYKDELKETISVVVKINQRKDSLDVTLWPVVWNATKYTSEFTVTWLDADIYTDYQLSVTMNHERYGEVQLRSWYLAGQLP